MKVLAIIQARMSSTRLPGKVLKEILGRPMLALQIGRLRPSESFDQLVVATLCQVADVWMGGVHRVLVTGATGLLGPYLTEVAAALGDVVTTSRSGGDIRAELDNRQDVEELLTEFRPDVVIHAAGLTDVDYCERHPNAAIAGNELPARHLTESLPQESRLVFISTDQVYPDAVGPHREAAEAPVNCYGRTKLAGEKAALRHPESLVLRSCFFGPSRTAGRQSLSDFFIENLSMKRPVLLFSDVLFSPLHMKTLADTVVTAILNGLTGVFNVGCRNGESKAEFAFAIASHKNLPTETTTLGTSRDIAQRAPRPHDLRMDVKKIEDVLGIRMPDLAEEVAKL